MNNLINRQFKEAYVNYNYFYTKMISKILIGLLKLSIILIISGFFDNVIIYLYALKTALLIMYFIYCDIKYYMGIINDIRETLNISDGSFEFDLRDFRKAFLKEVKFYER